MAAWSRAGPPLPAPPRIHAILAVSYTAFADRLAAAAETRIHIDQVTTEFVETSPIAAGATLNLSLVPGRTYEIPVVLTAGQRVAIATSSRDFYDTLMVLLAADGTPVIGSDDAKAYFAAFDYEVEQSSTYRLFATSFESLNTGNLVVTRD